MKLKQKAGSLTLEHPKSFQKEVPNRRESEIVFKK